MKIQDSITDDFICLTLWNQTTLNEIFKNSGELAHDNEFQVHFFSLDYIKELEDGSKIIVQVPTTIYNYPQEVSPSAIDFDLKEVEEYKEALKEINDYEVKKASDTYSDYFTQRGYKLYKTSLHSLHKHPSIGGKYDFYQG